MYIVQISLVYDPSSFENEVGFVGPFSTKEEAEAWMDGMPDMDDLIEANVYYMNSVAHPAGLNYPENWGTYRAEHYSRRLFNEKEEQ